MNGVQKSIKGNTEIRKKRKMGSRKYIHIQGIQTILQRQDLKKKKANNTMRKWAKS